MTETTHKSNRKTTFNYIKKIPRDNLECLNQMKSQRIFVRHFLDLVLLMSEIPKLLLNSGYHIPQLGLGTGDVIIYMFNLKVNAIG